MEGVDETRKGAIDDVGDGSYSDEGIPLDALDPLAPPNGVLLSVSPSDYLRADLRFTKGVGDIMGPYFFPTRILSSTFTDALLSFSVNIVGTQSSNDGMAVFKAGRFDIEVFTDCQDLTVGGIDNVNTFTPPVVEGIAFPNTLENSNLLTEVYELGTSSLKMKQHV